MTVLRFFLERRKVWLVRSILLCILVLLWLPGLRLPITSDTTIYALLGESLWRRAAYALGENADIKFLPLHAFVSYPFVWFLGAQVGMKISSLFAGGGVLLATFLLFRRAFGEPTALLAAAFVLPHHAFALMTQLGSADLLFATLFLGSLAAFAAAAERPHAYVLSGALLGAASLTRYNALPLFVLFPLFVLLKRPRHLHVASFWCGIVLAIAIAALWPLRSWVVFGTPFHTGYGAEYRAEVPSVLRLLKTNILYYAHPLHSILPIPLGLAVWGLLREGRRHPLLLLGLCAGYALALVWWVRGMRFAFPAYPILLGFSAVGLRDLWNGKLRRPVLIGLIALAIAMQAGVLCLYTYGRCNAWVDRTIGIIPADLRISSEGLFAFALARDYIDAHAPQRAIVIVDPPNTQTWRTGVFRQDLRVVPDLPSACAIADRAYEIAQGPVTEGAVFVTSSLPTTAVFVRMCPEIGK